MMAESAADTIRMQIRVHNVEDPELFAVLSSFEEPSKRARKARQLLRKGLMAEKGIAMSVGDAQDDRSEETALKPVALPEHPTPVLVTEHFDQNNFADQVAITPGVHFSPRILKAANA